MIRNEDILTLLRSILHPESGENLVDLGMVENLNVSEERISLTLSFARHRDPLASSLKKNVEKVILTHYPQYQDKITIFIKEAAPKPKPQPVDREHPASNLAGVKNIIAVSSAKGGVGKSTVTANLAVALSRMNYRVGVLDADLYGPSQPTLFNLENYSPVGEQIDGEERIIPGESLGIKLMSIGFFIDASDALIWRGPMATNALRQMIRQTLWGELDFLLIDMPPGTGDIHLSILQEMSLSGAIIVSTPQKMALADVVRGISMFRNEKIGIPVLGLVENMAWFTPEELPDHKYYLFGKEGTKRLAEEEHLPLLAQIPLIQNIRESSDEGKPVSTEEGLTSEYYRLLAKRMIEELDKQQQHGKS